VKANAAATDLDRVAVDHRSNTDQLGIGTGRGRREAEKGES
jgi:hypothetical protein